LFVWDGARHRFVTDLLGVGGLGYLLAPGQVAPADPTENLMLPEGLLRSRDDRYILKLTEPMEENCYLDGVKLVAYDLPAGWRMILDERMRTGGPIPTGAPLFYRVLHQPTAAVNDRGE